MKLGPRPTGRPWTPAEDEQLLALLASGLDRPSIAQKLKRSVHAITSRERAFLEFFGRREANDAASQEEDRGTSTVNQVAEHPVSANPVKQTKTGEELAAMIGARRQGDRIRSQPMELSADIWRRCRPRPQQGRATELL